MINQKNKKYLHHVSVHECSKNYEPKDKMPQECGSVPLPENVTTNCMQKQIIAWGTGGQYVSKFFCISSSNPNLKKEFN